MRVLQVITDTDRRGAQVFATELGPRLVELGLAVRTVALARGGSDGVGAGVEVLGEGGRLHPSGLRRLRAAMADADVVVAHGSTTLPASIAAGAMRRRPPLVYRQISDPAHWAPTAARRLRVRAYYRFVDRVVALSPVTARTLAARFGVDPARITVIPNAADERRFERTTPAERTAARAGLGLPADAAVVAIAATLVAEKGVADLAAATAPSAHLLVAGEGPVAASLEHPNLHRLGVLADLRPLYAAADVFALPSWTEQHPGVLVEAGLRGLPTIATRVGAVAEIVDDGVTGVLVPPRDVRALRRALDDLLADADRRRVLGAAARARCLERFSLATVAPAWADVLTEISRRGRGRRGAGARGR